MQYLNEDAKILKSLTPFSPKTILSPHKPTFIPSRTILKYCFITHWLLIYYPPPRKIFISTFITIFFCEGSHFCCEGLNFALQMVILPRYFFQIHSPKNSRQWKSYWLWSLALPLPAHSVLVTRNATANSGLAVFLLHTSSNPKTTWNARTTTPLQKSMA